MKNLGIYIHIPFCARKCKYCDFTSFEDMNDIHKRYINVLIEEIKLNSFNDYIVNTIYIGGGTPSYIDSYFIVQILNTIKEKFNVKENVEITIEINPGTVNKKKLQEYKKNGINRVSLGLQSTNNRTLELIGRIHSYEEFLETYEFVRKIGFDNINVDLMLGLPNQTLLELEKDINELIKLNPNHISIYSLILEEGTALEKMVSRREVELVSESLERRMYWKTKKTLEKNGYIHYEISNFAKPNDFSKHNVNCWNQEEYIGFGLSAHSYVNNKRFSNTNNLMSYIENIEKSRIVDNVNIEEHQTNEEKMKEYMLLGFRKISGISISEFERKFRVNPLFYFRFEISKLSDKGLIEVDLDSIILTKKGLDLANRVFEEFV